MHTALHLKPRERLRRLDVDERDYINEIRAFRGANQDCPLTGRVIAVDDTCGFLLKRPEGVRALALLPREGQDEASGGLGVGKGVLPEGANAGHVRDEHDERGAQGCPLNRPFLWLIFVSG
jgi:hypothetical protein